MAHIKVKILNIDVSADSDRQMMIAFHETICRRIPLYARKVHDYMKEYMKTHSAVKNPICARTREDLSPSMVVQRNTYELPDGWVVHLNANSDGYKQHLNRIADAIGILIDYNLHGKMGERPYAD